MSPPTSAPRLVVVDVVDLERIVREVVRAALDEREPTQRDDGLLDRAGAAKWLAVSLSTLDLLSRREHDPIPFSRVGDARRFDREELREWFLRQPRGRE